MTCEQFSALMSGYLKSELSPEQLDQAEAHLASCGHCQLSLQILRDCQTLDDGGEVPASFSSSWRQAITEQEEQHMQQQENAPKPGKSGQLRRFVALAASLVLVIGGAWLVGRNSPPTIQRDESTASYEETGGNWLDGTYALPEGSIEASRSAPGDTPMSLPEPAPASDVPEQAKIIRTVSLRLSTTDFDGDLQKLSQLLKGKGGYVEYSDISVDSGTRRYASFTLRVPKDRLDEYLGVAQGIGYTLSFSESQEDVSEQYMDTDTRLATQKAKMERLQALLSKALLVEDILQIEREIADTQYQIERLTGSLRGLDSKVDYATVSLYVTEQRAPEAAPAYTLGQRILNAVSDAWYAARTLLEQALIGIIVIAPYLLILAAVVYVLRRVYKRRKNK